MLAALDGVFCFRMRIYRRKRKDAIFFKVRFSGHHFHDGRPLQNIAWQAGELAQTMARLHRDRRISGFDLIAP
jgi:hypothetical protein